jgi:hypothetical protein
MMMTTEEDTGRFMTMCWNGVGATRDDSTRDNATDWRLLSDEDILEEYALDGSDQMVFDGQNKSGGGLGRGPYGRFFPCSVIAEEDEEDWYHYYYEEEDGIDVQVMDSASEGGGNGRGAIADSTASGGDKDGLEGRRWIRERSYVVRIFPSPFHRRPRWDARGLPRIYTDFPRSSIRHFTKPGLADQHSPQAFRHHIEIPDEMVPPQWKNRKNGQTA